MRGRGHHEPWGGEPRRRQLVRVLLGLGVVVVLAVVAVVAVRLIG